VTAIRTIDMRLIDDLFGMGGGYVLDFSDRTFGAFFREEIGVNIDDPRYSADDMLDKGLSFADVIRKKARRAAESGRPFVRVRDLFE
jgi:hypothetical protein